jgi:TRAP-type C4-dicarboxylate transport system permease small subunit
VPATVARRSGAFILAYFEEIVAGAALVVVVLSVCWGVLTRYVTAQPAPWASEVASIGFAWVTFFGASACFRHGAHPSIDMLVRRFPPALQSAVRWLNHVLMIGLLAFLTLYGIWFSIDAWDNPSPVLRLPLTILYGPVTFASFLMLVRYVETIRRQPHIERVMV